MLGSYTFAAWEAKILRGERLEAVDVRMRVRRGARP
jgi:hypothetical protein